jgi:DedD protein
MNKGWSSFMDRRVKERLVGASILVVLVVLIVPELLSGPKRAVIAPQATPANPDQPMRSVTIDLATSKATAGIDEAAPSTAPLNAIPTAPSPDTVAGAPSTIPSSASPPTPPPAATLESGAPSPISSVGKPKAEVPHQVWTAQVGSFTARENALKLERQLRAQGFSPVLSAAGAGRALRYRVRLGPVADRGAAQNLIAQLAKAGHSATLIPP